ncbi:MAG TPA: TonB-dependent receptor [Rhizomicrobium sp.]|nr:TonB-dependent receptor [Rhizomicrobium sp.]
MGGAAVAQDAGQAGQSSLETVIITAEKNPQSLRDTPASTVVTTAADLDNLAETYTTTSLLERIPNIVVTSPGNSAPAVRGLDGTGPASGADAFFAGSRPRLNYQVDGRTLGYNDSIYLDSALWDVQQVEVYRGAQSTLQGRNAIAGVIAIKTKDPTFDWEGDARVLAGNQGEEQVSGAVSGPLIDDLLAFRLAADFRQSEFYVPFTSYPEDKNPGRYRSIGLRGKLLLTPAGNVTSLLTIAYNDARAPQSGYVAKPYDDLVAAAPLQPVFRVRTGTLISDTNWTIGDLFSAELNLSGSDFRVDRYSPVGQGNARIDGQEYVAQPFLRAHTEDGRLSGFIAAYVFRTHQNESIDLFGGGTFHDRTETTAGFGELTYKFTPALRLTAGARYEEENRYRVGSDGPFVINLDATYKEFLPKATLAWDVLDNVTIGATAGRGYNGGGAGFTYSAPFISYEYKPEFVWDYEGFVRASLLDHRLTLTGNVFYNDYKDLQLPFVFNPTSTVIRNAERATTYGAEVQANYKPVEDAEIFASIGLLQTKVNEDADPTIQGNELPRSPAFTSDVGFNVTPWRKLTVGADLRYTDAYYSDAFNNARGKTSPYAIVNAQVSYDFEAARIFVATRNLFDSRAPVVIGPGTTPAQDIATLTRPRTFTVGLERKF